MLSRRWTQSQTEVRNEQSGWPLGEFYRAIRAVLEVLRVLSTDFWWVRAHSCYHSRVWSVSGWSVALLRNATARRGATDAGNSVGVLRLAGRFS